MDNSINKRIRQARINKDMTLLEVANKLGVTEATVQRYESGEIKNIKHKTIQNLSNILDVSPSYLMGWEVEPEEDDIKTIAAHAIDDLTEEEQKELIDYAKYLKSKRKKD